MSKWTPQVADVVAAKSFQAPATSRLGAQNENEIRKDGYDEKQKIHNFRKHRVTT